MKIQTKQMITEKNYLSVEHQNGVKKRVLRCVTNELSAITPGRGTGYTLYTFVSLNVPITMFSRQLIVDRLTS